jgi:uncharacterized protein (DUF983 family)
MATVAKSWLETQCPKCACRRVFHLTTGWVLTCSSCGHEKRLEKTGILAA